MNRTGSIFVTGLLMCLLALFASTSASAQEATSGELLYRQLRELVSSDTAPYPALETLTSAAGEVSWEAATAESFRGHIRILHTEDKAEALYLIRDLDGDIYILTMPEDPAALDEGSGSAYAGVAGLFEHKLQFEAQVATATIDGVQYSLAQLVAPPERLAIDRLFFIAIVLLLFLVMVGMGMTLTVGDFALVLRSPKGVVIGVILQFGLLPLLAMALGHLAGFYDAYPFIFIGLILVAASPGGVTSNLMTYLGKGDVALSVSLTALCTVLAIVFTPLMMTLYGSNIPDFSIPVVEVVKTMMVLVIVPLFVGMVVRAKSEGFAKKAEKPFAILGLVALLFLIVVGIWSNADKFADTDRYGLAFYGVIFALTLAGMVSAGMVSKLMRVANYQIRAISLEVGLRNASLSMTIALLLQDQMGDFSSSMFFTSGIFGLWMYIAGAITIFAFPKLLPLEPVEGETATS